MTVDIGDTAPDFTLSGLGGEGMSLEAVLQGGKNALLVFLRHMG